MGKEQDPSVLLAQYSMRNSVVINNVPVILSIEPSLILGSTDGVSSDYSQKPGVAIFAEQIVLSEDFKAKNASVAAHTLTTASGKKFDLAGNNGIDSDMPLPADGSQSQNGQNGGNLVLYLEDVGDITSPDTLLDLEANGGNGGIGKMDKSTHQSGNGGNGGNGGSLLCYAASAYQKAINNINNIISLTEPNSIIQGAREMIEAATPEIRERYFTGVSNLLKGGATTIDTDNLKKELKNTEITISYYLSNYQNNQNAFMAVSAGEGGICESSNISGQSGTDGMAGNAELVIRGTVSDLLTSIRPGSNLVFLPVHPAQCSMLLNQVKAKYMLLNTNNQSEFQSGVTNLVVMLNRLLERTEVFVSLQSSSPLYQAYTKHEQAIGAHNSVITLANMHQEASMYLRYLSQGLDFFGYQTNYVPLMQITDLQSAMEKLIDDFGTIENYYTSYLQDLHAQTAAIAHITYLRDSINGTQTQVKDDITHLWKNLRSTEAAITGYKDKLVSKKQLVQSELDQYRSSIAGYFNFDIDRFLDAASTIAFAPSEPAMWAIEGSKFVYDGATEIKDDQGNSVQKDYIVHQIDTISGSLRDISEGFHVEDDHTIILEDPGANKLIADENNLSSLLDEFYGKFPAETTALKDAIQEYVSCVIARNNLVMKYNACVSLLQQKYALKESNRNKLSDLDDQFLSTVDPDLPYVSSFALEAYSLAQSNVVHIMGLASRAYRLWTLDTENLCTISTLDGMPPIKIDHFTLSSIYNSFYTSTILTAIHKQPNMTSSFVGKVDHTAYYNFSNNDYFGDLRYGVTFSLEAQRKGDEGPFGGMSTVRVGEVRVFLKEAKLTEGHKDEDIVLSITHGEIDKFVTNDNKVITFSYDGTRTQPFHYSASNPSNISVQVSFKVKSINNETNDGYPVLSPFTDWTITASESNNPNLDYSSIMGVTFEFDGTCTGFD